MRKVGRGMFTTAYLRDDGMVELHSVDPVKECMSHGWFPSSRLFPTITRIATGVYETKYYKVCRGLKSNLKPLEYAKYLALKELHVGFSVDPSEQYDMLERAFHTLKNKSLREAMLSALQACSNYGQDIGFEVSPRNVAVSKTGNLILLDLFFMKSALNKARENKRNT